MIEEENACNLLGMSNDFYWKRLSSGKQHTGIIFAIILSYCKTLFLWQHNQPIPSGAECLLSAPCFLLCYFEGRENRYRCSIHRRFLKQVFFYAGRHVFHHPGRLQFGDQGDPGRLQFGDQFGDQGDHPICDDTIWRSIRFSSGAENPNKL